MPRAHRSAARAAGVGAASDSDDASDGEAEDSGSEGGGGGRGDDGARAHGPNYTRDYLQKCVEFKKEVWDCMWTQEVRVPARPRLFSCGPSCA
jgi:hypothetical protein